MAERTSEIAIVGLGAMGSAAAYAIARRGRRVIGFDRYRPPHVWGSSHGESRIIREAYFEQPLYVPLVRRAYARWRAIEEESGARLLLVCGGLNIGRPDGPLVSGALASARMHGVAHEELPAAELQRRVPAWRVPADMVGVWEPGAGILLPERCIETMLSLAAAHGARFELDTPVIGWRATRDGVEVRTAKGVHHVDRVILAAGSWARELASATGAEADANPHAKADAHVEAETPAEEDAHAGADAGARGTLPLTVERNVAHWFAPSASPGSAEGEPDRDLFRPDRFPLFLLEPSPDRVAYGFPDLGTGVKAAWHHRGELVASADAVRREVDATEIDSIREVLARFLPEANGAWIKSAVCTYTNTPDYDFILDHHPAPSARGRILIASPCSGHGFKFASAIGEILADLALNGHSDFDLTPFRLARFDR